jgi:hypothetical protein
MENVIIALSVLIIVVVGTGLVKNLIKLTECDFEAPYKAEVIHTVGLIPPVGMITGWLDVGK